MTITNKRDRAVEEFITTNQLHIANEESCYTTFQNSRGASNIDLTILNTAIKLRQEWALHEKDSCSDHIIQYALGNDAFWPDATNNKERRCKVTKLGMQKFLETVLLTMENIARESEKAENANDTLDEELVQRISMATTSEAAVEEIH
jgi:hypothetical protein